MVPPAHVTVTEARPVGPAPRKLLLCNRLAPGDIVMLTAAVRDSTRLSPANT